jgi:ankyrin repeat protein
VEPSELHKAAERAFRNDDAAALRELFSRHPELRARVNEPISECFDSPPITMVRSREMLDVLLEAGADINAKSRWWAGGFGLLHSAKPELARYAVERGAVVDIHAAARLGMFDQVRELIAGDPQLVHERGGDGQTPLHFASTREIAAYLLDHGANIDACDVDHESTPAQWMLGERSDIARYLVSRGCSTDILIAAALGDLALVRKHLEADPESIRMRVSDDWLPMVGGKAGGTIYQWTLGWHVSAHQVAKKFGHEEVFQLLTQHSPPEVKLINAAWLGNEGEVDAILLANPHVQKSFTSADLRQVAHAARNNDLTAVRLLLKAGLPVNARSQHNATPLHWAAWHGNAEMVRLILRHSPDLEDNQNDFDGTPMRWAIHGSENGWYHDKGDYAATVELLLDAGARPPETPGGTQAVKAVLERRRTSSAQ